MAGGPGEGGYYAFEGGVVAIDELYSLQRADRMKIGEKRGAEAQSGQLPDSDALRQRAHERSMDAIR